MSGRKTLSNDVARVRARLSGVVEPPPVGSLTRLYCYPWLVVGTTCVGAFIGQLDASIVQLALPALEREFHTSLTAVSWVAIAYLLAFAAALPVFARLSEMFGRKSLYLAGYIVFVGASALCGGVSSLTLLITFRFLQGVGGAMLGANSITILTKAAGPHLRGRAMGLFAAAQAVGISAGPVIGGVLLATLGWRWIFWVSIPFGLTGAVIGWLVLPRTTDFDGDKRFDWRGAILLVPALTAIVLALSEVQSWGPKSPALIGTVMAGLLLLALFIRREKSAAAPLIDLHLFRIPAFSGGVLAVNLSYALLYSMFFLISFAFIRGLGESPVASGLRLAIIPVALGLVAPISGAMYERVGERTMTTAGMALSAAALLWLAHSLVERNGPEIMGALALFGIGLGMFIAPNNSATLGAAPDDRAGEAGGLLNLMRVLGCTVGVATASTALSWRMSELSGEGASTLGLPTHTVLAAVTGVFWVLGGFAVVSAGAALVRAHRRRTT